MPLRDLIEKKLIMVGGKGGVGKTTCASAIALHLAGLKKRTLIISSDPTPSLSDIFEVEIGPRLTQIPPVPELFAQEITSELILTRWKERFGPEIYEVVSNLTDLDRDFVLDYIGSAPGIEEEYLLYYIFELVQRDEFEVVVWDTAPAGHTLKLLKLPTLFLKHLEGAAKFYLQLLGYVEKAKEAVGLKAKRGILEIVEGWKKLSEDIEFFLKDRKNTAIIIVTIPEALGVKQTERIYDELQQNGLWVDHLIINQVITNPDCQFHRRKAKMQDKYINHLGCLFPKGKITHIPSFAEEVKGITRITLISSYLFDLHLPGDPGP